jgi:hypothetical protein
MFLVALLGAGVVLASGCSGGREAVGDGNLLNKGWPCYYPRFRIELPSLQAGVDDSRTFSLRRVPPASYTVRAIVTGEGAAPMEQRAWDALASRLRRAGVALRLSIAGGRPQTGEPLEAGGRLFGAWFPARWGNEQYFTMREFDHIDLKGSVTLSLAVSLDGPEPLEAPVSVRIVLVGGGFEI